MNDTPSEELARKLREAINGVNIASDTHGEHRWYGENGDEESTIMVQSHGVAKADHLFIRLCSPANIESLLDALAAAQGTDHE